MPQQFESNQRVVILGGGPGGYSAALAGAQLGAEVTLIERDGIGGSAVLTDVVPSKTLIATAEAANSILGANDLGVEVFDKSQGEDLAVIDPAIAVDLGRVNKRTLKLAAQQSEDIRSIVAAAGVNIVTGQGRLDGEDTVVVDDAKGKEITRFDADTVVVSVGASPRTMPSAMPDGERILTWTQLYSLEKVPEHLIVVGSGVTGAEFASAYRALGSQVTLVSSREMVLPGEDKDAAEVIENVFVKNGMNLMKRARAKSVVREGDQVIVTTEDGRTVIGSHALMAVGSIPNTQGLGLAEAGVQMTESGHIRVNRVARTSVPSIYAAGDCTNFMPLASVAQMQGRTAIFHALGDSVTPMDSRFVTSNIFTQPEIATVGWTQEDIENNVVQGEVIKLPLSANPRAKMLGIKDGFVKLFARTGSGTVLGGVIVSPKASELIFPLALAFEHRLTVDQVARAFAVYPSLTGSILDAAQSMHIVRG
ncbi:MAG: NAD(P)H-quinone dehydrogenase [Microbacteriaceae bacterium]|nr:NAD(P)H-quinone dehydrogenase [Microbacteriaceae bacterium]